MINTVDSVVVFCVVDMAPSNLDPVKVAIAEVKGMADMFKR